MKFLVLLFLVGCAAANFHEVLEEEAEYVYQEFMLGLEDSGALKDALGHHLVQQAEDEIKTELGKRLREMLDDMLDKIKDSKDKTKEYKENLKRKLKELKEQMDDLRIDIGNKAKEMIKNLKEKVGSFWQEILDKLKGNKETSIGDPEFADFNLKEVFRKLRDSLLKKIDKEKLKAKIEELFGKGNDMADSLLDIINEKGEKYKQKLHDLIDRYLGKKEVEERSLQEYWEKLKEYFKNLQIDLKEKYAKFGEWVRQTFKDGLEKVKDKKEKVTEIAREFLKNAKDVRKDVAEEALEFLRPYKEDLGSLWEQLKVTVKDIVKNQS